MGALVNFHLPLWTPPPTPRPRYIDRSEKLVFVTEHRKLYRFTASEISAINHEVFGHDQDPVEHWRYMTNEERIKACLSYLAGQSFQVHVGQENLLSQCSVSRSVHAVVPALYAVAHKYIKFPTTEVEIRAAQLEWRFRHYLFPYAIGVVDGTQIPISRPPTHEQEYICRKGFHSIAVMLAVDATEKITYVSASFPGCTHDSRVFKNSALPGLLENAPLEPLLLGDSGYSSRKYLVTPFSDPQTPEERSFNKLLVSERSLVERVIGQLKRKFPVLRNAIRIGHPLIPELIVACCILFNIAKDFNIPDEPDSDDSDDEETDEEEEEEDSDNDPDSERARRQGERRRQVLAREVHSMRGRGLF